MMNLPISSLISLLLITVLLLARARMSSAKSIQKRGAACEHESFYCDSEDPAVFHRCLDGMYYTFTCPTNLHFSVKMQACDWPETADCSFDKNGDDHNADEDDDYVEDNDDNNDDDDSDGDDKSHRQSQRFGMMKTNADWSNYVVEGHSPSWIREAASSGKSWWRPSGAKVILFKDLAKIKIPSHVFHVSDKEKKSGGSSKSVKVKNEAVKTIKSSKLSWNDGECKPSKCHPPSCFCAGTSIPNGIPRSSTPQMVMITFDDEVSPANYGFYQRLFRPGRYNPNGCPVKGCLFVSGSGTVYDLVYPLYALGMEIASHSVSHRFPHNWWANASYNEYIDEAVGERNNLVKKSGIPAGAIKGFRVPFLELGSDRMYSALYDSKFSFDSSMFTGNQFENGEDPAWPFTLDYLPSRKYCQYGSCPKKQYPGMWEIPVQRWYGLDGHACSMADGCTSTGDDEETLEYLKSNFRRYYNSNRAPLGLFVHARWFESEHNLDGLDRFVDYLLTLDDVYIVSPSQVIEWMRKPTPLSSIHNFEPWSCKGGADYMSWSKK